MVSNQSFKKNSLLYSLITFKTQDNKQNKCRKNIMSVFDVHIIYTSNVANKKMKERYNMQVVTVIYKVCQAIMAVFTVF